MPLARRSREPPPTPFKTFTDTTYTRISLLKEAAVGFVSGLLVAIGGAIKDAPYEGFDPVKFIRSPLIGAVEAPLIATAFKDTHPILLGMATIATERLTVETYKLIRAQVGQYIPGKFLYGEWGVPKPTTF